MSRYEERSLPLLGADHSVCVSAGAYQLVKAVKSMQIDPSVIRHTHDREAAQP